MYIKVAFVLDLHVLESLTVRCKSLGMIHNRPVTVVHFFDEKVTLSLIGLFELTELLHDIISMLLQVLEDLGLNLVALIDLLHAALHGFCLIVDLVIKNFALSVQVGQPQVDLLKNVKLSIRLEYRILQVFNFGVGLFLILPDLVDRVLVFDETVHDWVNELLHKMASFRLNIEPKEFERWIICG